MIKSTLELADFACGKPSGRAVSSIRTIALFFGAVALGGVARAASPLLLPSGATTLPDESAGETRKALVAAGKSLVDDKSTDVWILQYDTGKTMASAIRRLVADSGATLLSPVSGGAYLVRATKAQQLAILESGKVEATRPYAPGDKGTVASGAAGAKSLLGGAPGEAIYVVDAFSDADEEALRDTLAAMDGCEVQEASQGFVRVRMTAAAHAAATALPEVESIGEWLEPVLYNDFAVKAMRIDPIWPSRQKPAQSEAASEQAQPAPARRAVVEDLFSKGLLTASGEDPNARDATEHREEIRTAAAEREGARERTDAAPLGLTGKGQIVAVCDSGLDTGDPSTLHPDVRGRVLAAFSYARQNDWSDLNGHGTHVAGSVLGNGAASDGQIRGAAYEAELVFQSCGTGSGPGLAIPNSILDDAFGFETRDGRSPRIHSDSWGSSSKGGYNEKSCLFDVASFVFPPALMVTSAGNAGADQMQPAGVIDPGSMGAPGTSKNALTVGAAETGNHGVSGDARSYFECWPGDFPNDPIRNDPLGFPPSSSATARGMAAFSSRGPCKDGRIKPDVVAPGCRVLSLRAASNGRNVHPENDRYCFMQGTSMACPLVAGTAALVRQWLVERKGVANPDAATMKALLCAGAKSLAPGQYGTGQYQEIPFTYPNNVEGWGMVDLENTVANPDGVAFRDGEVIEEGATLTFRVTATGGRPLCILMAYSDAPATSFSGGLINDLDLVVTDPAGRTWYPNSQDGPDRRNNVEGVRWPNAPAGTYIVTVKATQIQTPMDKQWTNGREDSTRFSIVANGAKEIR